MVKLDNGSKPFATHTADKNIRKMMPEDVLYSWAHEEVMAVMQPKEKRNTPECLAAKEGELAKLKNFGLKDASCRWYSKVETRL